MFAPGGRCWWVACPGCNWWARQLGDEQGRIDALNMAYWHATDYPSHLLNQCRLMETRPCPVSGCEGKLCARFQDDDESRWDADDAANRAYVESLARFVEHDANE